MTEEERAQKRAADREYARQAIEALRSADGWRRWLATRAIFHKYSLGNQLLIAMQRPTAVCVAGFRRWLQLGYCVAKGEKAIRIWAPCPPSPKQIQAWTDAGANPHEQPRTFFRLTSVFADDQVAELPPPAVPQPISCPIRQLEGDDLAQCLPALVQLAHEIGSSLSFEPITGPASATTCRRPRRSSLTAPWRSTSRCPSHATSSHTHSFASTAKTTIPSWTTRPRSSSSRASPSP